MRELSFLAAVDFGEIITVIVAMLYGGIWLFRKIAESREQASETQATSPEPVTEGSDREAMQRFFSSLGIDQNRQAEQTQPPERPKPKRPKAKPQAAPVQDHVRVHEGDDLAYAAGKPFAHISQVAPAMKVKVAELPKPTENRLEFPNLTPLQRAIVLCEIIGRRRF